MKTLPSAHGGDLGKGKRKSLRPIDPKQALHVVLRATVAKGKLSMLHPRNRQRIDDFVQKTVKRTGVRVYRTANVGNHFHLLVRVPSRRLWKKFIRELSGGIATLVTQTKKGTGISKNKSGRSFWDELVFTRIVKFGADFRNVKTYVVKNLFEAAGFPMKKLMEDGQRIVTLSKGKIWRNGKIWDPLPSSL